MEARCQCGLIHFSIPFSKPQCLVVCHCDRCKLLTGSAYYISAPFPGFAFPPPEVKDSLSTVTNSSENGRDIIGWFCKGCGNRMAYTQPTEDRDWVSVSATKIVGFDWGMLKDKEMVWHIWTASAVVDVPEGFRSCEGQPEMGIGEKVVSADLRSVD